MATAIIEEGAATVIDTFRGAGGRVPRDGEHHPRHVPGRRRAQRQIGRRRPRVGSCGRSVDSTPRPSRRTKHCSPRSTSADQVPPSTRAISGRTSTPRIVSDVIASVMFGAEMVSSAISDSKDLRPRFAQILGNHVACHRLRGLARRTTGNSLRANRCAARRIVVRSEPVRPQPLGDVVKSGERHGVIAAQKCDFCSCEHGRPAIPVPQFDDQATVGAQARRAPNRQWAWYETAAGTSTP